MLAAVTAGRGVQAAPAGAAGAGGVEVAPGVVAILVTSGASTGPPTGVGVGVAVGKTAAPPPANVCQAPPVSFTVKGAVAEPPGLAWRMKTGLSI
jgi:hypothetical protein